MKTLVLSGVSKGKAVENICGTWDGSEGEAAKGYQLYHVTAVNL
ncbi:MAG: hypothetical protein ABIO55_05930 [Ginsengibacter sp.]